jgi:hypothetical protein
VLEETIEFAFAGPPATTLSLQTYLFLSQNINRLLLDISHHMEERTRMFREFLRQRCFGKAIYPVMMEFRRSLSPTPLLRRPLTPKPIIMTADDGVTNFSPGSPRSVRIHSPTLDDTNQQSESTSNDSFHTADSEESRSQSNPINVDTFEAPVPPHPSTIHQLTHRRTRSIATATQCTMCGRFGHDSTECIWRGPIICEYCKEIDHVRDRCPKLHRDIRRYNPLYQFCIVCNRPGHTLDRCFTLLHSQ